MSAGGENERCYYCGQYVPDMELHTKQTCTNILDRLEVSEKAAATAQGWHKKARKICKDGYGWGAGYTLPRIEELLQDIHDANLWDSE